MPKPFPAEFRRDVVAVARKHEAPISLYIRLLARVVETLASRRHQ
ncbi:hypothetical protein ABIB49_001125 [Arthrobacter sp. UYCu512]